MGVSKVALFFLLITGATAADTNQSSAAGKCNKFTGGTCAYVACHPWRNAVCEDAKCVCDAKDTCSFEGRCDTAEAMKLTKLQEEALTALAHLSANLALQTSSAARITAQNDDALQSIEDTKAAVEASEAAADCREQKTKDGQALDAATKQKAVADGKVIAAQKASGQGFGKAKDDQNKAMEAMKKASIAMDKASKRGAGEETKRDNLKNKAAAEKKSSTLCESDTGGSCNALPCHAWRNAVCVGQDWDIKTQKMANKKCLCPEGSCAFNGMCVPSDPFGPLLPKNRSDYAKAVFEKEMAVDKAALKANEDATCVKNTGRACNLGYCVLYDAWDTATCVKGECVCNHEDTCVFQGVCAHKVTSADLGADVTYLMKLASVRPSTLPHGFISIAALVSGVLISAGVIAFDQSNRRKNAEYRQPLLDM